MTWKSLAARPWAAVTTAVLFTVGCATLAVPVPDDVKWVASRWPDTTYADLLRGRELYVAHCAGCHTLHRPERYAPEKWPSLVRDMEEEIARKRAKKQPRYTEEERDLILRFLTAASARVRAEK